MESNLKIVTYNLRCGWYTGDGINSRIHRSGMIWEIVRSEKPDIISFQEVNKGENLDNLRDILPGYDLYGSGRDGDFGGEGLYTAIRRETTELIGLNIFWLSPKPYEPNAAMYPGQSGCPRICVETLIRHKATGKLIRVYNVHLDFSGALNVRAVQMQQILDRMTENKKYYAAETVLLGDMNDKPHQNAIACAKPPNDLPATVKSEKSRSAR